MDGTLFRAGAFLSHSGIKLPFKIDCDALSAEDWAAIAQLVADRLKFSDVHGIPTGGMQFALALESFKSPGPMLGYKPRLLIVDDVLTTGTSMEEARKKWDHSHICQGVVLFARESWPAWIWPVFTLAPIFRAMH